MKFEIGLGGCLAPEGPTSAIRGKADLSRMMADSRCDPNAT